MRLNRLWKAVGFDTVRQAITFLAPQAGGDDPGYAMDFKTVFDEEGNPTLEYAVPMKWEDWMKLPVREHDLSINTSRGPIRVPLVVICAKYEELPVKPVRWSPAAVRKRDGNRCQVSRRLLAPHEGNTGHIVASSRGGRDSWENTIYMDKKLNTQQGSRSIAEMNWTLAKKPVAPKPRPITFSPEDARHPAQIPFLTI